MHFFQLVGLKEHLAVMEADQATEVMEDIVPDMEVTVVIDQVKLLNLLIVLFKFYQTYSSIKLIYFITKF